MSEATTKCEGNRVELLCRKATGDHHLTAEERLELFDANTKWLDELQSEQLSEAKAKGTRVTRENRGWTREDLYEDLHGLPR
jgi:hypothetical protein